MKDKSTDPAPALRLLRSAARVGQPVPIDLIIPQENLHRSIFGKTSMEQLTASIAAIGIIEPLVLRPRGQLFALVCGARRYRVALALEMREVPAVIVDLDDAQALVMSIAENVHRDALLPVEEARAYRRLIDEGVAKTQQQVAEVVKVSQSRVSRLLAILQLPAEVLAVATATDCQLTERHFRLLATIRDVTLQGQAAAKMVSEGMTVARAEGFVARLLHKGRTRRTLSRWTVAAGCRYRQAAKSFVVEIAATTVAEQVHALRALIAQLEVQRRK